MIFIWGEPEGGQKAIMKLSDLLTTPTTQPIDLGDWNETARGKFVHVWVDPPKPILRERDKFNRDYANFMLSQNISAKAKSAGGRSPKQSKGPTVAEQAERLTAFLNTWKKDVYAWYAKLWSAGPAETHWTVDEIAELDEQNPQLLKWLFEQTKTLLDNYGRAEKNA